MNILKHPMRGYHVPTMEYSFHEIFLKGEYDIPLVEDPIIVDCGANVGFSVLYFKMRYPRATLYAYEPNPRAFGLLKHNVKKNQLKNVFLRNAALSDCEGEEEFFINETWPGVSSLRQERGGDSVSKVKTELLSTLLLTLDRIDLVKIDVEGAEWSILRDLQENELLTKARRYVIEYHHQINGEAPRLSKFLAPFEKAGFSYQIKAARTLDQAFQDVLNARSEARPTPGAERWRAVAIGRARIGLCVFFSSPPSTTARAAVLSLFIARSRRRFSRPASNCALSRGARFILPKTVPSARMGACVSRRSSGLASIAGRSASPPLRPRRAFVAIWPPLGRCGSRRATARGAISSKLVTGAFCSCRPRFRRHGRWSCNVMAASVRSLSMIQLPARRRKAFLYASSSAPLLRLLDPFRPPAEPTLPSGVRRPDAMS